MKVILFFILFSGVVIHSSVGQKPLRIGVAGLSHSHVYGTTGYILIDDAETIRYRLDEKAKETFGDNSRLGHMRGRGGFGRCGEGPRNF